MSRRVGNFVNPQTGETDWLEPDTVSIVILQPQMVTKVGDTNQTAIDFKLGNIDAENVITLTAQYTVNSNTIASSPVKMNEVDFANQFAEKVYADQALDEADVVKNAKSEAVKDLTKRLMDKSVMLGGMKWDGFGFVTVDNDRVMSVEGLEFTYKVENNRGIKTVKLTQCVGQASLKNLENPSVSFHTGEYRISLVNLKVQESVEGRLKDYTVTVDDVVVTPDTTIPEHTVFTKVNFNSDDFLDTFINDRKKLLNDSLGRLDDLDDRLEDVF